MRYGFLSFFEALDGMNSFSKQVVLWTVLLFIAVQVLVRFSDDRQPGERLDASDFRQALAAGQVKSVEYSRLGDGEYEFTVEFDPPFRENRSMEFIHHEFPTEWETALREQNVRVEMRRRATFLSGMVINIVPFAIMFALVWFLMFRHLRGSSGK
jgi:ATP-dependent Zn protease